MRFTRVKIDNFFNLKDVNLDLTNGNTLIVGPNGAGKTNIIKCIHFLVDKIFTRRDQLLQRLELRRLVHLWKHAEPNIRCPNEDNHIGVNAQRLIQQPDVLQREVTAPKIWNSIERDCFVEVHAWFNKTEVELFSDLRLLFLMSDVCHVVYLIMKFLVGRVVWRFTDDHKEAKAELEQEEEYFRHLQQDEEGIFCHIPEETFKKVRDVPYQTTRPGHMPFSFANYGFYNDDALQPDNPCVSSLVAEFTSQLFPKLLEITKRAVSESQDKVRPMEGSDVVMRACTQKTVDELEYSIDVLNGAWLPAKLPEYKEEEHKVISSALQDMFGDLRGVQFCINHKSLDCGKFEPLFAPLTEAVKGVFETSYESIQVYPKFENSEIMFLVGRSTSSGWIINNDKLRNMMRYTDWDIFLARCLEKINKTEWGEKSITKGMLFQFSAVRCLGLSTVNCILPQSRGLTMEQDELLLTINSLEQLLIKSKLSNDALVQQQFGKLKDGMKSFCGIKIDVVQMERATVQENEEEVIEIVKLGKALLDKDRGALFEFGHRLKGIANEMIRKAPSWSGHLHVMVTRTLQSEGSSYSHRTPLSGLSGGEIEILMVLCAIHLSGADSVFLDEPGHSLHPPQQAQLSRWIETLQHPDPVCVTITHSVEFISRKSLSSLYHMSFTGRGFTPSKLSVDLVEGGEWKSVSVEESTASSSATPILAISTPPQDVTLRKEIIAMLMQPDMRKMFFASGVYFVEGETDKVVLSAVRHHLLKNARDIKEKSVDARELLQAMEVLEMDQWDILALGGCAEALKAYKASSELRIPCAIVLDLDTITVKHGRRVEPFSSDSWKKSRLCKELTKERQRNSLEVAAILLDKIDSVFEEGVTESKALHETRKILREHGIWIWEGDLEKVVCDNQAAREELLKTECFMEALGEDFFSLSVSCRGKMPEKDALADYQERIMTPLLSLTDDFRAELDAAHCRRRENPLQCVTENLQEIIGSINKYKQRLKQHDEFCQRGTKRRAGWKPSGVSASKKLVPDPSQQVQTTQDAEPMDLEDTESPAESTSHQPSSSRDSEVLWDRIKCKLHDRGGWKALPWETLLKVVKVCLDAEPSPLQEFCKFMKKWQCKGKKKMKVTDLPQSLLSKLFDSVEGDADD